MEFCRGQCGRVTRTIVGITSIACIATVLFVSKSPLSLSAPKIALPSTLHCTDPRCSFMEHYYSGKLGQNAQSCSDFYGYVCMSPNWRSPTPTVQDLPYTAQTVAALYLHLHHVLSHYPTSVESVQQCCGGYYPVVGLAFYRACINPTKFATAATTLKRFFSSVGLAEWPYQVGKNELLMPIWDFASEVDRILGIFPFILPSTRRRGGTYNVVLDKPSFPLLSLKKNNLNTYEAYAEFVTTAASIMNATLTNKDIEAMFHLEKQLSTNGVVGKRVIIRLWDLPNRKKWSWKSYLMNVLIPRTNNTIDEVQSKRLDDVEPCIFSNEKIATCTHHVIVTDDLYIKKFIDVIEDTDPAVIANYIGFRIIAQLSPFLQKGELLMPLLLDTPLQPVVPLRVQTCLGLLARTNKYALRYFSTIQLSNDSSNIESRLDDSEPKRIFEGAKRFIENVVQKAPFIADKAVTIQVLHTLSLMFLGEDISETAAMPISSFSGPHFNVERPLESYIDVQSHYQNAFWLSPIPDDHLSSRHQLDFFRFHYDYFKHENLLYMNMVPWGVQYMEGQNTSISPFYVPQIARHIVYGIYHVIIGERYASTKSPLRFEVCWLNQFRRMGFTNSREGFRVAVIDSTFMPTYFELYAASLATDNRYPFRMDQYIEVDGQQITLEQLFFINWAAGFCPWAGNTNVSIDHTTYRMRVNLPVQTNLIFRKVFNCKQKLRHQCNI